MTNEHITARGPTTATDSSSLIAPYGGRLVDLLAPAGAGDSFREYAAGLPAVRLSARAVCDLELLAVGAFSPLDRFMTRSDYESVLTRMRLGDGHIFPVPITLPVDAEDLEQLGLGDEIALRSPENDLLATMRVEEIYAWDRADMAQRFLGTQDLRHPLVAEMYRWGEYNLSGTLRVLQLPSHYDFKALRLTPTETRQRLEAFGHTNVVAFQTRNPLHRVHEELTKRATQEKDGVLLLHPVVGLTQPGDVDHFTRVRTYKALAQRYYDPDRILLTLLPLAMRMAGPREALWHALIRRNYGANYLIVGRDHAGPGIDSDGRPFYGPYEAQALVESYASELGVGVVPFQQLVYLPDEKRYEEVSNVASATRTASISGTQVREEYLQNGKELPDWFTRPEVAEILAETYPPRYRQGVCIWFTGLHNAGKSTTAAVVTTLLQEHGRQVTLLDGDVVRTNFSEGLGFSKEDRDAHVRRIAFVAAEIVRHGGIAVCAAVSPYRATRNEVRNMVGQDHYLEIYVDTPLTVCEQRDTKGLYARARRGEIRGFTGIDDPYEPPRHAEITVNTVGHSAEENAHTIVSMLLAKGFVRSEAVEGEVAD